MGHPYPDSYRDPQGGHADYQRFSYSPCLAPPQRLRKGEGGRVIALNLRV